MTTKLAKVMGAARERAKETELVHSVGSGLVGLAVGMAEAKGKTFPRLIDAVPIPANGQAGLVLAFLADAVGGKYKKYIKTTSNSLMTIAGYQQGRAGFTGGVVKGR
jgi:hypothetical protein